MRKMIFLALSLLVLSAAGVKAQVNIGSTDNPKPGAVLDLQTGSGGNKGLLLPLVELATDNDRSKIADPQNGLLVCNLTGTLDRGVYYWSENKWIVYIKF